MAEHVTDYHFQYMDMTQHWHPESQPHAGCDALLTAVHTGWQVGDTVTREDHWLAGMRYVAIYHFQLMRGAETMIMPVVNNPYVNRFINRSNLRIVPKSERAAKQSEPRAGS